MRTTLCCSATAPAAASPISPARGWPTDPKAPGCASSVHWVSDLPSLVSVGIGLGLCIFDERSGGLEAVITYLLAVRACDACRLPLSKTEMQHYAEISSSKGMTKERVLSEQALLLTALQIQDICFSTSHHSFACLGCKHLPACALCPVKGGMMVATKCGRLCHMACVLWTPEAFMSEDGNGSVLADVSRISKVRLLLCLPGRESKSTWTIFSRGCCSSPAEC